MSFPDLIGESRKTWIPHQVRNDRKGYFQVKRILIVDKGSFSRICSAILELDGHKTEILQYIEGMLPPMNSNKYGLIIISYPFGPFLSEEISKMNLPKIILTDHINVDIVNLLQSHTNLYCMIKPLDYRKFRSLVKKIISCDIPNVNGFKIL
ncbi:MAG: DNA-binding response regulator [Nitrospirota bacterium]